MTKRLIIATLVSAVALTSCNKGTISSKRLDGTCDVKTIEDVKNGTTAVYTNTTTKKLDGKTNAESFSSTSTLFPASTSNNAYTVKLTFAKSDDSYTKVTVSTTKETSDINNLFTNSTCTSHASNGTVTTTSTSTETVKGVFTVLGSTGDIGKNTRFLMEDKSSSTVSSNAYVYMDGSTVVTTPYEVVTGQGCVALVSADTKTETVDNVSAVGDIVTVKESTKSEMTVEINTKTTDLPSSNSPYTSTTTTTGTITYTKE